MRHAIFLFGRIFLSLFFAYGLSSPVPAPARARGDESTEKRSLHVNALQPEENPSALQQNFIPGELIVLFRSNGGLRLAAGGQFSSPNPQFEQVIHRNRVLQAEPLLGHSLRLVSLESRRKAEKAGLLRYYRLQLPAGSDLEKAAADFRALPEVADAFPNALVTLAVAQPPNAPGAYIPNDPLYPEQWYLPHIGAPQAWDLTTGLTGTLTAVVDTGVDYTHPDLAGKVILGPDVINNDADPMDDHGHGTQMAGVIAAATDNTLGVAGLDWRGKILAVKVMRSDGTGDMGSVVNGMYYAAELGARVINLSLGSSSVGVSNYEVILDYINNLGAVIVAAAGNENSSEPHYPGASNRVLGVAATNQDDTRASSSNYAGWVDIAAPGVSLMTTQLGGGYVLTGGTSGATAVVSGVAALVRDLHPTWTADRVMSQLASSSYDIRSLNPGYERMLGAGRIDAAAAVGTDASGWIELVDYSLESAVGDSLTLFPALKSFAGLSPAVTATLSTSDTLITIADPLATYGDLRFGDIVRPSDPFSIQIDASLQLGHILPFTLTIQDAAGGRFSERMVFPLPPRPEPGWPQPMNWTTDSSPLLANLDADPALEVFQGSIENQAYAWQPDGSLLPGWPVSGLGRTSLGSASADLNRDGTPEIIAAGNASGGIVAAFQADGTYAPGWPNTFGADQCPNILATPALGDVTGDGYLDVVIGTVASTLYVFNPDGSPAPGWPQTIQGSTSATAALADLDSDGSLEIIVATWMLGGYCSGTTSGVYVFRADGSLFPGWPYLGPSLDSSPVVADLDNDGQLEIAVANYAFEPNGSLMPGFPVSVTGTVHTTPAVADLDGDGGLDLVFADYNGRVYAVHADGTPLSGWPLSTGRNIFSSPLVLDLDGDSDLEIIGVLYTHHLYAWHHDGSPLVGFPLQIGAAADQPLTWSTLASADTDRDGRLELFITGGGHPAVHGWQLPTGSYNPSGMPWPEFHHDAWRTGLYGFTPTPALGAFSINHFSALTSSSLVTLTLSAPGMAEVQVSNDPAFAGAAWQPLAPQISWSLQPGDGVRWVYVRFRDGSGALTPVYRDSILLDSTLPHVAISSPVSASQVFPQRTLPVMGTAADTDLASYELSFGFGLSPTSWIIINRQEATSVNDSLLGEWRIDDLPDGWYTLRLLATDQAGLASSVTSTVELAGLIDLPGSLTPPAAEIGATITPSLVLSNPLTEAITITPTSRFILLDPSLANDIPFVSIHQPAAVISLNPGYSFAQSFSISQDTFLRRVEPPALTDPNGYALSSQPLTIELRPLSSGLPAQPVLKSLTIQAGQEPAEFNYWLDGGQSYALVFRPPTNSWNASLSAADTYAQGSAFYGVQGTTGEQFYVVDGDLLVQLFSPLAIQPHLASPVSIPSGGAAQLDFLSASLPVTFTTGVNTPLLWLRGSLSSGAPLDAVRPLSSNTFQITDGVVPTAAVQPLPEWEPSLFTVFWSGSDNSGGPLRFDAQRRSSTSLDWRPWLTATLETASVYFGEHDERIAFRVRATDPSGNTGEWSAPVTTTVDSLPPSAWLADLPDFYSGLSITLTWSGQDTGSGIVGYELFKADQCGEGIFYSHLKTTLTQTTFTGSDGCAYRFLVEARDRAGNVSQNPVVETILLDITPPSVVLDSLPAITHLDYIPVSWQGTDNTPAGLAHYDIQVSKDGQPWSDWLVQVSAASAYYLPVEEGFAYAFRGRGRDWAGNISAWSPIVMTTVSFLPPPTPSATQTPIEDGTPSPTSDVTPSPSSVPTNTQTPMPTWADTETFTPSPTAIYTQTLTPSPTMIYTQTLTPLPTPTASPPPPVTATVDPDSGGSVTLDQGMDISLSFPPQAVSSPVTVTLGLQEPSSQPGGFELFGQGFYITALSASGPVTSFLLPFELQIAYDDTGLNDLEESLIKLFTFDEQTSTWIEVPGVLDKQANIFTAWLSHLSDFAIFQQIPTRIYLPLSLMSTGGVSDQPWYRNRLFLAPYGLLFHSASP